MTQESEKYVEELVNRWSYLIWNEHAEMSQDFSGIQAKVRAAINEALEFERKG